MHIKKLEISGFKSFVDRTVVHFDHDVVGIVGPNGCGKSNIVDSIRWCMGEQSARHLRGRSMTDVIFGGSANRGPHGMAEVTLTFDNSDKETAQELPLEYRDWSEIAVTRRLYRDGTSEYLINKTQVRLKDVTDLFLGTGVGTKAYSIIEQGKVGLIVSARPEDRRLLIEEAAGITKYKARRKQAEQKMDATRQNLLRVGDIVAEIERSLASLKRQAAKAERYISYKGELEDLLLHEASHRLLELIVRSQVEETERAASSEESERLRAALDAREAEVEVTRQTALTAEDQAEKAQTDSFRANNDVRTHQAEIDRAAERYRELEERRSVASVERNDLATRLEELAHEREAMTAALETAQEEESRGEESMQGELDKLEGLREQQQEADLRCNELRKQASETKAKVAAAEATVRGFEQRAEDMQHRREALEDEDGRLTIEMEDVEAKRSGLAEHIDELNERKRDAAERREALSAELKELREEAVQLDKEVDHKKSELSQKRNRLRALEELHSRLEGVGQGPRALMSTKDPAIVGLVADRFEAPADLTHAFAAALSDKLQWVVVDDVDRGLELLDGLAKTGKGRAAVVSRNPRYVAGATVNGCASTLDHLGYLVDRVSFAPEDEGLARALFGDLLIVADNAAALTATAAGYRGRVVTLEGNLHGPDGAITGGAGDSVAEGMIEHKREMRELHEAVASAADAVSELLARQEALRARISEIGTALERARNDAHQAEITFMSADKDLKRSEEQLAQIQKRLVTVRTQHAELVEKITAAKLEHENAALGLEEGRTASVELEGSVETAETHAEEWRKEVMRQQSSVTERKVLLAQVRERANSVRQTAERLAKSCEEMRQRIERLDREMMECAVGAGQAAGKLFVERELLQAALTAAKIAEDALIAAKTALDEVRNALAAAEVDIKKTRDGAAAATEKLRQHETNLAKLEIEHRHLLDGVRERFRGLELATVVGDYHKRAPIDASHRSRITALQELLDRMGPVNLDAVREHKEAEERYSYYTTQKADLDKALADLEQAITQMNRETKRLFKEAFDGINAKFKVIFPRMFRGGQAELRLTNPEDMLETGIEILAQPPGKKLVGIDLMSGGEKALTAVSLIFSIFTFKPSPFCILDEVDAPLDEANVARYNEAIRMMTDRSQFILITHIKKTMQSVDVLYGVTMQEPGVSKLVSVKVNETAAARSTNAATTPAPAAAVA
ncbi:MAG: chromosome segregation protein SMC [Polyangiaceae bacterium]|nr:chromosome segregation protein SMC [Polyangiaceae bacterium]